MEGSGVLQGRTDYILVACLSVCLFVSNITQKVINVLQLNFIKGSGVV